MRRVPIFCSRTLVAGVFVAVVALCSLSLEAQPPQGQAGAASQGAKPSMQLPKDFFHPPGPDDMAGFVQIFDGKTLEGWDGDPTFWRVENGVIVGESTPEKVVSQNTFLIWRGGVLQDFELKVEFRMNGVNTGIQVRSIEMPAVGKWVLKGYQADADFGDRFTGNIHDERGRNVIVSRGQAVRITADQQYKRLGTIADAAQLNGMMKANDWNQYHIIGRGPMLVQFLNGRLVAMLIDEDTKNRALEGVLGFQMHVGPPFKVAFRNIWYRKL
jgi:3-keto-disaccharide hydrolase